MNAFIIISNDVFIIIFVKRHGFPCVKILLWILLFYYQCFIIMFVFNMVDHGLSTLCVYAFYYDVLLFVSSDKSPMLLYTSFHTNAFLI